MVEVADVADDELIAQAIPLAQGGIGGARRERLDVDAVGHDRHALGGHAAGHDVGAHRVGQGHDGVRGQHRAQLRGVAPAVALAGGRGIGGRAVGPGRPGRRSVEQRAHLVHDRQPQVLAHRQPDERRLVPAPARRRVDDRRPNLARHRRRPPGVVLEVGVDRPVRRVARPQVEPVVPEPVDLLDPHDGGVDRPAREPERRHDDRIPARLALGQHVGVAAHREAGLALRQGLLEQVEDEPVGTWHRRPVRAADAGAPAGVGLGHVAVQPALRLRVDLAAAQSAQGRDRRRDPGLVAGLGVGTAPEREEGPVCRVLPDRLAGQLDGVARIAIGEGLLRRADLRAKAGKTPPQCRRDRPGGGHRGRLGLGPRVPRRVARPARPCGPWTARCACARPRRDPPR